MMVVPNQHVQTIERSIPFPNDHLPLHCVQSQLLSCWKDKTLIVGPIDSETNSVIYCKHGQVLFDILFGYFILFAYVIFYVVQSYWVAPSPQPPPGDRKLKEIYKNICHPYGYNWYYDLI